MTDRPTPVTNEHEYDTGLRLDTYEPDTGAGADEPDLVIPSAIARALENSRDEAVELLTMYSASHHTCIVNSPQGLCNKCRMTEAYLARLEKEHKP